jgi:cysteinyl-tRNA synthetase
MTMRFFVLQAQYRSTLDFSNEALQASEKGLERLFKGMETLENLTVGKSTSYDIEELKRKACEAMNDDLNSPVMISHLFDGVRYINSVKAGTETISATDKTKMIALYKTFTEDILGLKREEKTGGNDKLLSFLITMLLDSRIEAKKRKDFAAADKIRDQLTELGVIVKDTKDGYEWEIK